MKRLALAVVLLAACGSSKATPNRDAGTWDCKDGSKITWTADSWTRAGVKHQGAIDFAAERTSCFG